MYSNRISVSKTDSSIKAIIKASFPEYTGRKIFVEPEEKPIDVTSYWSGGSRSYYVMVDLKTYRSQGVPQNGTPFDGGSIRPNGVEIPVGFAIVEHDIFCGKDMGIKIHVHPESLPKLLKGGK